MIEVNVISIYTFKTIYKYVYEVDRLREIESVFIASANGCPRIETNKDVRYHVKTLKRDTT